MTLTASLDRPDRVETVAAEQVAEVLLERMRETPMRRGALPRRARTLRTAIARAIASQSVPEPLSRRIAFQLAFKLSARELHGRDVWEAVGRILRADILCLRERLGLTDHKIVGVLPKLSATRILEFLEELTRADRRIARTILNAAVDAADPLAAGRRYLAEYRLVARQLRAIDPTMARTLANATFTAVVPLSKAMEHLDRLSSLRAKTQDDPETARLLARAGFRTRW
jgi:hypothetical protein